jgi:hypothetical protein
VKNKAEYIARSTARRLRLQEEARIQKAKDALLPKVIVPMFCKGCDADITTTYRSKAGQKCPACAAEYMREYRKNNAARISKSKKQWVELHAEHKAAQDKAYATKYPERRRVARAKWDTKNPGATTAAKAINKAERKQRVPVWLSEDDRWMIAQVYELAELRTKMLGFPWHVDHVVPLNGKRVSGLHVPQNLQVIPGVDNLRKGVSFEQ